MQVAGRCFADKAELHQAILSILRSTEIGELLGESDFEFMLEIFKQHPNFDDKKGYGVQSITVGIDFTNHDKTQGERKFILNTVCGQANFISYTKAIQWGSETQLIKKKLIYLAKRYFKSVILNFRESDDRVCEKTWKLVPQGDEVIYFKDGVSRADIVNQYYVQLNDQQKAYLLNTDAHQIHKVMRHQWLEFIKTFQPTVVHPSFIKKINCSE